MRLCPTCGGAMVVAQTITVGGLENKDIAWRCEYDGVMAELRHPIGAVVDEPHRFRYHAVAGWSSLVARRAHNAPNVNRLCQIQTT